MWKEFRTFAMRGNVIDLAIGVIIGSAFGKITTSLVNDVLMPPVGLLLGNSDFANLFITLGPGEFTTLEEAKAAGVATLNYGLFVNTVIDFAIIAFVIFLVVKQVNRLRKSALAPAPAAPTTRECPMCLSQIPLKAKRCAHCTSEVAPV